MFKTLIKVEANGKKVNWIMRFIGEKQEKKLKYNKFIKPSRRKSAFKISVIFIIIVIFE